MSLSLVRPYFETRISSLGFSQWEEPFNYDALSSSLLDRSFHLEEQTVTTDQTDAQSLRFNFPMRVRLAFKGYREPKEALKECVMKAQEVILDLCNPIYFDQVPGMTMVTLSTGDFSPLDEVGNDNVVLADLVFDVRVSACIN